MAAAVDDATKAKLMEVFTTLDRNGSLQIDQREVEKLVNKLLNKTWTRWRSRRSCRRSTTRTLPARASILIHLSGAGPCTAPGGRAERHGVHGDGRDGSGCISVAE